jgi:hypothetical protein
MIECEQAHGRFGALLKRMKSFLPRDAVSRGEMSGELQK